MSLMTRVLAFTGLVLLSVLAAGVLPRPSPKPAETRTVRASGVAGASLQPAAGPLERSSLAGEARFRTAALTDVDGISGGLAGTLLLGTALVAAAAFILLVLIPW